MIYHKLLLFLHVIFVALYVGSGAALGVVWRRRRKAAIAERRADIDNMLEIGRRVGVPAGSLVLVAGLLMLLHDPPLLTSSGWFLLKVFLGVGLVILTHMAFSRTRQVQEALSEDEVDSGSERFIDIITWISPFVVIVIIFIALLHNYM